MGSRMGVRTRAIFMFSIICLAYLSVAFHRVSPAIMAQDIMRETSVSAPGMGLLASIFFITFGLMQLPGGLLADSWGPRKILPAFLALAGIGGMIFAMGNGIMTLSTGRALMGFGVSITFVCGLKILTLWFPTALYARLNGMFLGIGGLGLVLGSGPLAYLCEFAGWRGSMMVGGFGTLILAVLIWVLIRDTPEEAGYPPVNPELSVNVDERLSPTQAIREMLPVVRRIFASGNFWMIAIWFCAQFSMQMAYGGLWAGAYMVEVHGMSKTAAGNALLMMGVGMLIGAPLNGWLSDVVFAARKPVMLISSALSIGLFALLIFCGDMLPHWFFYVWFFLLAAFGMGSLSAGFAAVRDIFGAGCTATASGFLNTFPSFMVAFLQMVSSSILEMYPRSAAGFPPEAYARASLVYLATACIALVAALLVKEAAKPVTASSHALNDLTVS